MLKALSGICTLGHSPAMTVGSRSRYNDEDGLRITLFIVWFYFTVVTLSLDLAQRE